MASTQTLTVSFASECLTGIHVFGTDTIKIALYTSTASMGVTTTAYTTTNEVSGTGYVAGGTTVASVAATTSGSTAYVDLADASWAGSTITARYALIYNSSKANRAIAVIDFGGDKTSSASTFTVTMPTAAADSAIIRWEVV